LPVDDPVVSATRKAALEAVGLLKGATGALLEMMGSSRPDRAMAVAVPYMKLCGYVAGGWLMARAAAIAARHKDGADREFYSGKLRTALFYAEQVLPVSLGLARIVTSGADSVVETEAALV
jgi:3-(methylthio)propanoyl-CoA dehydrogenase